MLSKALCNFAIKVGYAAFEICMLENSKIRIIMPINFIFSFLLIVYHSLSNNMESYLIFVDEEFHFH